MTQYKDAVEYQARKIHAEKWGNQIKYLLGQNGYLEKALNNGEITREYNDGRLEVIASAMPLDTVILHANEFYKKDQ